MLTSRRAALRPFIPAVALAPLALAPLAAAPLPARSRVLRAVPADGLVVLHGRPLRDLETPTTASALAATQPSIGLDGLIGVLTATGVLSGTGQVYADIAACLPILARGEFAIALLDVTGRAPQTTSPATTQPSFQLEQLQAIVVLRTDGANDAPLAAISRMIARYTNETEATLTTRSIGDFRIHRLSDRRTAGWAVCEWVAVEDLFIVTIGSGAVDRVIECLRTGRGALSEDPWFRRAMVRCGEPDWLSLFLNHRRAAERLPPATMIRIRAVMGALDRIGINRDLWSIGLDGREWTLRRVCEVSGRDRFADYSADRGRSSRRQCIPPAARHFAIVELPLRTAIEDVTAAVLAARRPARADAMRRWWAEMQSEAGFDVGGEILSRLGDELILFDYPPHPLGVAAAITIAAPIREPQRVRAAVDAVCGAWQRYLGKKRDATLLAMSVRQAADGVWYVQAGIVGPALTVTDDYIVLSWSPQALREACAAMAGPDR